MEKFSSFSYLVRNDFIYKDKVEVRVFFIYLNQGVVNKSLFLDKVNNKPERLYIADAKKIVNKMIENGSLEKYAEENIKHAKHKKMGIAFAAVMISALVVAGASAGIYFAFNKPLIEAKVDLPEINGLVFDNQKAYIGMDYDTNISVNTTLTDNLVLPDEFDKVISGNRMLVDNEYTYNVSKDHLNGTLHIPGKCIEGNIKIELRLITLPWYRDVRYLDSLTKEDVTKENPDGSVGVVQSLKVNGLDHKVRLIGVDEDYGTLGDENTKIHTTWEFVNLISDEEGHYLATQWNDTNDLEVANHDYRTATIRNALNGENVDNVLWGELKNLEKWSDTYHCSVLDMINAGNEHFGDALKIPEKYVTTYDDNKGAWDDTTTFKDKLFLLTSLEMGEREDSESSYSYYAHRSLIAKFRIKREVDENDDSSYVGRITNEQKFEGTVWNYAGNHDYENGGYAWSRLPVITNNNGAYYLHSGFFNPNRTVYERAFGVAPAFCL